MKRDPFVKCTAVVSGSTHRDCSLSHGHEARGQPWHIDSKGGEGWRVDVHLGIVPPRKRAKLP